MPSKDDGPPGKKPRGREPFYLPGDPIPAPEAVEENSEAAWELWQELHNGDSILGGDSSFAGTRPSELSALRGEGDTLPSELAEQLEGSIPRHLLTVEDVMAVARKNNRICPRASQWGDLFKVLARGEAEPPGLPPPVQPTTWHNTSALHKRACLRDQIVWAANHGGLRAAYAFLLHLPEESWHHMGE
jgi:hypothetical protein